MWRSIGSVNSIDKHNHSREDNNYESFANASKLKLNESQLSGEPSGSPFLNQYFVKKRSPEGMLQRVLSHKNIESRPFVSPPCSAKEVVSPRMHLKSQPNETIRKEDHSAAQNDRMSIEEAVPKKVESKQQKDRQCKVLKKEVTGIRNVQISLKKDITGQFSSFSREMQEIQEKIASRMVQAEQVREKDRKESFNPQMMSKLRQQSTKFGQKMRQIDLRKEKIRQKYRNKQDQLSKQ